jgi:putative DNA primase/helicase
MSGFFSYATTGAGRVKSAEETAESRRYVRGYWHHCDYARGTPVSRYLAARGLPFLTNNAAIRSRANCRHSWTASYMPAMVALVLDQGDNVMALHRTYLTPDGRKADVVPNKASLGSLAGGAIHLDPVAEHILVGEGIETAASAGFILGLPAWSAIACGNLGRSMLLPEMVRTITIACDYDNDGIQAAERAAKRWRKEGRTVHIAAPTRAGEDFNDLLRRRLGL